MVRVPGGNLLGMALRVINKQSFSFLKFKSRALNMRGLWESIYEKPVPLTGSVQPVPRVLYQQYGLDFQANYFTFFIAKDMIDIKRERSGDMMQWKGQMFECLSSTDWFKLDGWDEALCVEIPSGACKC